MQGGCVVEAALILSTAKPTIRSVTGIKNSPSYGKCALRPSSRNGRHRKRGWLYRSDYQNNVDRSNETLYRMHHPAPAVLQTKFLFEICAVPGSQITHAAANVPPSFNMAFKCHDKAREIPHRHSTLVPLRSRRNRRTAPLSDAVSGGTAPGRPRRYLPVPFKCTICG
jgi:hypothetical protein